jgi:hypothetical protein
MIKSGIRTFRQSPFKKEKPLPVFNTSRGHQLTQAGAVGGGTPSPFTAYIK